MLLVRWSTSQFLVVLVGRSVDGPLAAAAQQFVAVEPPHFVPHVLGTSLESYLSAVAGPEATTVAD